MKLSQGNKIIHYVESLEIEDNIFYRVLQLKYLGVHLIRNNELKVEILKII